MKWYRT